MFKILKKSKISKARLGIIKTAHGGIETPCFMPDATRGAVKHLSSSELIELDLPCLVANTLHLFLRPGVKIVKQAGGLHNFMAWPGPILSDSGGYQVFSLIHKSPHQNWCGDGPKGRFDDTGAIFTSPLDGAKLKMTPELSIKTQFALGADLMVCFDDCPPNDYNEEMLAISVERTLKWAKRCKSEYEKNYKFSRSYVRDKQITNYKKYKRPLLFAVIQGGNNLKLREHCAQALVKIGFDGFGFGARHINESGDFLAKALKITAEQIPENKPRFGLGIGKPEDIIRSIKLGWDIFDCVIPTREGRHGRLFLFNRHAGAKRSEAIASRDSIGRSAPSRMTIKNNFYETINIANAKFAKDFSPINPLSRLTELRRHSKAYLHYLFKISEPLALRLASLNNLEFYLKMISEVRAFIKHDKF